VTEREPSASEGMRLVRSPAVLWRDLGDEVVLTTAGQTGFELLSATASTVWRMLERPRTTSELVATLAVAYGEPAERIAAEVGGLLDDLKHRGMVAVVSDAGS
jgi:hypothetical protein